MKLLLLPNGIEQQCAKQLARNDVAVRILSSVSRRQVIRVLICQDGRGQYFRAGEASGLPESGFFEELYRRYLGVGTVLEFHSFSFYDPDVEKMETLVKSADILYFCGFGGSIPERLVTVFKNRIQLVHVIRAQVQYDKLIYIGICGGAKISGKSFAICPWRTSSAPLVEGVTFFDFFEGMSLRYDACVGPSDVTAQSNTTTLQITSGCGIAFFLHNCEYQVSSFPVVKNMRQWLKFAGSNSELLMALSAHFTEHWISEYDLEGIQWRFRLDGCFEYRGKYLCAC